MTIPDTARILDELPRPARAAVAPLHKVAFGAGVGAAGAAWLALLTGYHAILDPQGVASMWVWLLGGNFLPGVEPTALGALVAALWGLLWGFVAGWTIALVRNTVISVSVLLAASRARLDANRNVLDDLM